MKDQIAFKCTQTFVFHIGILSCPSEFSLKQIKGAPASAEATSEERSQRLSAQRDCYRTFLINSHASYPFETDSKPAGQDACDRLAERAASVLRTISSAGGDDGVRDLMSKALVVKRSVSRELQENSQKEAREKMMERICLRLSTHPGETPFKGRDSREKWGRKEITCWNGCQN